jgi:DNA-binding HxlR family transcriptional regulator
MPKKRAARPRSGCPLNASVEMLGDRWSLLIIRDMMLRDFRSYKEFLENYEGIATNILANRLRKLMA